MSNQAYNFNHVSQVVSLTTDDLPIQPTSHSFNGTQSANEDDGKFSVPSISGDCHEIPLSLLPKLRGYL